MIRFTIELREAGDPLATPALLMKQGKREVYCHFNYHPRLEVESVTSTRNDIMAIINAAITQSEEKHPELVLLRTLRNVLSDPDHANSFVAGTPGFDDARKALAIYREHLLGLMAPLKGMS